MVVVNNMELKEKSETVEIPIDLIKNLENSRIRSTEQEISPLMEDIKHRGLLQPIGVVKEGNEYIIRFGNRRLTACRKLGWKTIPAIISNRELNEDSFMADNIAENFHRLDLSPIELAQQCKSYLAKGYNASEISVLLTMPIGKIKSAIGIEKESPELFKKAIIYMKQGQHLKKDRKGKLPKSVAGEILTFSNYLSNKDKNELLEIARKDELSGPQIRLIKNLIKSGFKLEEAIKENNLYKMCYCEIPIKIKELKKYDIDFLNLIKGFITGKIKPNKELLR